MILVFILCLDLFALPRTTDLLPPPMSFAPLSHFDPFEEDPLAALRFLWAERGRRLQRAVAAVLGAGPIGTPWPYPRLPSTHYPAPGRRPSLIVLIILIFLTFVFLRP